MVALACLALAEDVQILKQDGRNEEVGQQGRHHSGNSQYAPVAHLDGTRNRKAGESYRDYRRRHHDGETLGAEGVLDSHVIVAITVVSQVPMVDEMDGIVYGDTQHHGDKRCRHHV